MRFEQKASKGVYSITIDFADRKDPDELQVVIGFRPTNRSYETFQAFLYMMVVEDRYIPYSLTHKGEPPCQLKLLAQPIARCAFRFLESMGVQPTVRVVEW